MLSFAALADPTRRRIVEMLAGGELSSGEIAGKFEVSAPAVSQHLKVLREAKLVRVRVSAQRRMYGLDPAGLDELDVWLTRMRRFWDDRLDALKQHLEAEVKGNEKANAMTKPAAASRGSPPGKRRRR